MMGVARKACAQLCRLLRAEDGNATVEFVIIVPIYIALLVMSLELSFITLRLWTHNQNITVAARAMAERNTVGLLS